MNNERMTLTTIYTKLLHLILLCSIIVLNSNAVGQDELQVAVDKLLNDPALQGASIGLQVQELDSKKALAAHNPDLSLVPASSMKVLTTQTALVVFGKDHRFETHLILEGEILPNGDLAGNVLVRGFGDPTLGSSYFDKQSFLEGWVQAISDAGVKNILGSVRAETNYFDGPHLHGSTSIEDGGNYYAAGVHGINVYDNQFSVFLTSDDTAGNPTFVSEVKPEIPGLLLLNQVLSSDSKRDNAYIHGHPLIAQRTIYGTIPKGRKRFEIKGAVPDPAILLCQELKSEMETLGITSEGVIMESAVGSKEMLILKEMSPTLREIVNVTNRKSVNLFATALLMHLGKEMKGEGSINAGAKAIESFWTKRGLDTKGMVVKDGSGLSRANALTARQLAEVSGFISKETDQVFVQSLTPRGGRSNLIAKSGYVERVRAYTGRTTLKDGRRVSFAIIVNNYSGTAAQAKAPIMDFLVGITKK